MDEFSQLLHPQRLPHDGVHVEFMHDISPVANPRAKHYHPHAGAAPGWARNQRTTATPSIRDMVRSRSMMSKPFGLAHRVLATHLAEDAR